MTWVFGRFRDSKLVFRLFYKKFAAQQPTEFVNRKLFFFGNILTSVMSVIAKQTFFCLFNLYCSVHKVFSNEKDNTWQQQQDTTRDGDLYPHTYRLYCYNFGSAAPPVTEIRWYWGSGFEASWPDVLLTRMLRMFIIDIAVVTTVQ